MCFWAICAGKPKRWHAETPATAQGGPAGVLGQWQADVPESVNV